MDKLEIYNEIVKIAKDINDDIYSCLYHKDGTPYMITNQPLVNALREYGLRICAIGEKIEKDLYNPE